jgi:hypothetical protein
MITPKNLGAEVMNVELRIKNNQLRSGDDMHLDEQDLHSEDVNMSLVQDDEGVGWG